MPPSNRLLIPLTLSALFALACAVPFLATPAPPPLPTATPAATLAPAEPSAPPTAALGRVVGSLFFTEPAIPAMTVFLEEVNTQAVTAVPVVPGQTRYTALVPPGTYRAYAWLADYTRAGGVTGCLPDNVCEDRRLRTFEVTPGGQVDGIDVFDWHTPLGTIPYPPGVLFAPGTLSGAVRDPADCCFSPAVTVYARNVHTGVTLTVPLPENQPEFLFDPVAPGYYIVFAWTDPAPNAEGTRGGSYSQFVLCGLSAECSDHTPVIVLVSPNQAIAGIDLADWYAPELVPPP